LYHCGYFWGKFLLSWLCLASLFSHLMRSILQWHTEKMKIISIKEYLLEKFSGISKRNKEMVESYKKGKTTQLPNEIIQYIDKESLSVKKMLDQLQGQKSVSDGGELVLRIYQCISIFIGEPALLTDSIVAAEESPYKPLEMTYASQNCPICLDQFVEGTFVSTLDKCGHCFHTNCLQLWFTRSLTCPLCRQISENYTNHKILNWKEKFYSSDFVYVLRNLKYKITISFAYYFPKPRQPWVYLLLGLQYFTQHWRYYVGSWLGWCYIFSFTIFTQNFSFIIIHILLVLLDIVGFMSLYILKNEPEISNFMKHSEKELKNKFKEITNPATKLKGKKV